MKQIKYCINKQNFVGGKSGVHLRKTYKLVALAHHWHYSRQSKCTKVPLSTEFYQQLVALKNFVVGKSTCNTLLVCLLELLESVNAKLQSSSA